MIQFEAAEAYLTASRLLGQAVVERALSDQQLSQAFLPRQEEDGTYSLVHVACGEAPVLQDGHLRCCTLNINVKAA